MSDFKMIIVLGAARSGTSMISRLMDGCKNVVYIPEPKYIWKYKNFSHGHDMLTPEHLNAEKKDWIRNRFKKYLDTSEGDVLLEKTPSNSLRFEFVYNIFPEAKYVHIIRDGRSVALSARHRWRGMRTATESKFQHPDSDVSKTTREKITDKWKLKEIWSPGFIRELSYIAPLYLNNMGLKKDSLWGPLFPGLKEAYKKLELIEACALQWKVCTESVINFSKSERFKGEYFEIRYEDIYAGNESKIKELFEFTGLPFEDVEERVKIWREKNERSPTIDMTDEDRHLFNKHCWYLMKNLGYYDS